MSSKRYRPWDPDQMVLFPQAMRDALEERHLVFRILDVVNALDISCVTDRMEERDPRGIRPYHPRMMLALLMYADCCGIYSSRKMSAATYDLSPFRVLSASLQAEPQPASSTDQPPPPHRKRAAPRLEAPQ
jgi:transposase